MSTMRSLTRTIARNQSYNKSRTTDMFQYFFTKLWREKGHSASGIDRPTKKQRKKRRK